MATIRILLGIVWFGFIGSSWVLTAILYPQPRTAWSPSIFLTDRIAKNPMAGMVFQVV